MNRSPEFQVLNNNLLLSMITSYLDTNSLKALRLQSKITKLEAEKRLHQWSKGVVVAPVTTGKDGPLIFRRFLNDFVSCWEFLSKFKAFEINHHTNLLEDVRRRQKYQDAVLSFLDNSGADWRIKYLSFKVALTSAQSYEFFAEVLLTLKTVESVKVNVFKIPVDLRLREESDPPERLMPASALFIYTEGKYWAIPTVKTLEISMTSTSIWGSAGRVHGFVSSMINAFPNMTKLIYDRSEEIARQNMPASLVLLVAYTGNRYLDIQKNHPGDNEALHIFPSLGLPFKDLTELRVPIDDPTILLAMAKMPVGLKKLYMDGFKLSAEMGMERQVQECLGRHAETLEVLEIRESTFGNTLRATLPEEMPVLKKLVFWSGFKVDARLNNAGVMKTRDSIGLAAALRRCPLKQFPSLAFLEIKYFQENRANFVIYYYENFFNNLTKTLGKVRNFFIPEQAKGLKQIKKREYWVIVSQVRKCLPKAEVGFYKIVERN